MWWVIWTMFGSNETNENSCGWVIYNFAKLAMLLCFFLERGGTPFQQAILVQSFANCIRSWTLKSNIPTEACRIWDAALGFVLFCFVFFKHKHDLSLGWIFWDGHFQKMVNCLECFQPVKNLSYCRILDFKLFENGLNTTLLQQLPF